MDETDDQRSEADGQSAAAQGQPDAGGEGRPDSLGFRGDASQLYEIDAELAAELAGQELTLIVALDGYVDAGNGVEIALRTLTAEGSGDPVVTFDADGLIDYRSRRPGLTFSGHAFTSYDTPHLVISRLYDELHRPYLLFTGPEPDLSWEKFCAAVREVIEELGIRLTISIMAIPMGVPHTRPAGMSVHATRPEIVPERQNWLGSIEVPGHVAGLLEYRLGQWGHDAIGFAAHVPHYLARGEHPAAARALLDAAAEVGGLVLSTVNLTAPIGEAEHELAKQIAEHPEVAEVVQALEKQYDAFMSANANSLLGATEPIPTADEIAAQFEAYLANQDGPEE